MIPKVIHYCWFGEKPIPDSVRRCMQSWQKFCPDYLIVEWNEKNFNIKECPQYVIDAYHRKKWAFVTDYVRLRVVYEYGGIYFDTDVELVKKIDFLLKYSAFFGFENKKYISTGLGFGAERGCGLLYEMMEMYQTIPFILEDGSENKKTCPVINTEIFLKHGLEQKDKQQILEGNIMILPSICMCPIDFETGYRRKSKKTISVHWFHASWMERAEKEYHKKHRQALLEEKKNDWKYLPNRMIKKLLGEKIYLKIKGWIRYDNG